MASDLDDPRTHLQHARRSGATERRMPTARQDHLNIYSIASHSSSNSHSLKRKKSSESASTESAVTAPEDDHGNGMRLRGRESVLVNTLAPPRPFIAPRRSRPRLDDNYREARPEREPSARESSRRTHPVAMTTSGSGSQRRENIEYTLDHGRRDKGKGVDRTVISTVPPASRRPLPEPPEPPNEVGRGKTRERSDRHVYSGPLAHAEFERMRKEIEAWKKAAADNKKTAKKQAKKIEELKAQVNAGTLARKEQETQVQTLRAKVEKKEELITTIEHSLQCQICMDLLNRPYALSPCGHILCLHCLREWFRKAPPSADDSDIEDDPHYILNRSKSCPCCRAVVIRRPVPVFVVKSVATAISNYKAGTGARGRRSPSPDGNDPWKGLFPSSDDDEEADLDSSGDDEVYEDALGWAMQGLHAGLRGELGHQIAMNRRYMLRYDDDSASGSGSDDDEVDDDEDDEDDDVDGGSLDGEGSDTYEGIYVAAQWEPPRATVDPEDYVFRNEGVAASTLQILRRGCTIDMIRIFGIGYSHSRGLVAHLHSLEEIWPYPDNGLDGGTMPRNNRVFLGWNVQLDEADISGEAYMQDVLNDMKENPARWTWTQRAISRRPAFDVKRLMRVEDVEDYDTTDTEVWLDANDPYH
ncbi:hypothetical protein FPV67DRAFT_593446 [Lyophyllum atratum]|nr:hypothetical protein FPV67DRAFT_593446 [Lyophyllum atratum]